jgi:hypothetical protein
VTLTARRIAPRPVHRVTAHEHRDRERAEEKPEAGDKERDVPRRRIVLLPRLANERQGQQPG